MTGDKDEQGKAAAAEEAAASTSTPSAKRPNAFAELMRKKKTPPPPPARRRAGDGGAGAGAGAGAGVPWFQGRDALGTFLSNPAAFMDGGRGPVLYYTDDFVALRDKFPKSVVHFLLLPRDAALSRRHPVALLSRRDAAGAAFRQQVRAEADKLRALAAAELRRRLGQFSAADARREAVMRGDVPPGDAPLGGDASLPPGRDWAADVLVGVHARPSMSHMHVHVLSRDLHSDKMRHRRHYNSFATPFFVRLDEFPLAADDPRQPRGAERVAEDDDETADDAGEGGHAGSDDDDVGGGGGGGGGGPAAHPGYLRSDLRCWRCGRNFGNRFQELRRHLDVEFEAWKRE